MTAAAATLDAAQFARAFPFHLLFDDRLRLIDAGPSLRRALPELAAGEALAARFDVARPREAGDIDAWRRWGTQLITLTARDRPAVSLRGSAEVLDDGRLLLLVSPLPSALGALTSLGLGFNDFARHDAIGDLLLLTRTTQISVDDAQRLAERLRGRTEQLRTIIELSVSGVAYVDADGRVQQVNSALLKMLGLDHATVLGMDGRLLSDHLASLHAATGAAVALDALADDAPVQLAMKPPAPAMVELRCRRSSAGGRVVYLRDVTRETEVDRMKSEFLSTAAHELRTPMVSILGFAELLLHRDYEPRRRRAMLETIHRQAGVIVALVNELLDLARIEARRGQDFHFRPQPLMPVLHDAAAQVMRAPGRAPVEVLAAAVQPLLSIDADKLRQAIGNLLSNAYKYSPAGGRVTLQVVDDEAAGSRRVGVRVTDEGIGMTDAQRARAFERFYRADPSGNIPGTGLGLCIVKEIVELHGGSITLDSRPGVGTCATLWLPVADDAV
ncbi:MAG: ATP-binding protein, partial [Burkholderiaceae bacterium]|nr:ATP-binding protein [Burkholderiaceae bacterium]